MPLAITLACGDYDRTRALIDGSVRPEGIDLNVLTLNNAWARHQRMALHEEFDACELSTSSFLLARDRGQKLVGIPVFPYRMFRHNYLWCSKRSGIREPKDLRGKRIGVGMYQITTAMWIRGFLQHDFGIRSEDLTWVTEMPELVPLRGDMKARIEVLPAGKSAEAALLSGEIDVYIAVEGVPALYAGRDDVYRLFPDYRAVEMDYYRRTRLFPIMHTIVVKEHILQANPWAAVSLLEAFRAAKRKAMEQAKFARVSSLAWFSRYQAEEREVLGADPYPYSWEDNRHAVEAMCAYSFEQGMTSRQPVAKDLFAPSTLDYPEARAQQTGRIQTDA